MIYTLDAVKKIMQQNEAAIHKLGVKEIYLFGSVVRGESKDTSDVDFFVVFEPNFPVTYFLLNDLSDLLEGILNKKVDLGTKNSLHPLMRDQILKEAIRVA